MLLPLSFNARNAMERAAASSSKLMQNYTLKPVKISIKGAGSMQKEAVDFMKLVFDHSVRLSDSHWILPKGRIYSR